MAGSQKHKGFKVLLGDESNPTFGIAVGETSRALHIFTSDDYNTDWNVAADTHPSIYVHSATTPATDYVKLYHDATNAYIDGVGATALKLLIGGTAEVDLTATAMSPSTSDGNALGTASLMWGDLFLASGAVVNFNAGDVTITHSANSLAVAGGTSYTFDAAVLPSATDGAALGSGTVMWSDLFLASGAVVNFNNGDVTITHAANLLTVAGGNVQLRGSSQTVVDAKTTSNITTAGAGTYTAAQLTGGRITRDPSGAARTDTTDTAALIVAGVTGAAVGDSFICVVENTADAAEAITLAGGGSVTLERLDGTGATIPQNGSAVILFVLTNVTGASETVSAYVIAS